MTGMELVRELGSDRENDTPISDEELAALALAADPEPTIGPDAVALPLYPDAPSGALPPWYMPPVTARAGGWRVPIVVAVILVILLIDAVGLCMTYGVITAA